MTLEQARSALEHFQYSGFVFDPEKHRYTLDGAYLPSVTGLVKRWKKPFDAEGISARVAAREGKTPEQVRAEWKAKGDFAANLGTEVHAMIEDYWNGILPIREDGPIYSEEAKKRFAAFLGLRQSKMPNLFPVAAELRVFSRKFRLAGTIDFLAFNRKDGRLYIFDWKTNGKFRTDADRAFDKLSGPFSELDDNEHNAYSIQLSTYQLILREAGIDVEKSVLVWLPPGGADPKMVYAHDFTETISEELGRGTKGLLQPSF